MIGRGRRRAGIAASLRPFAESAAATAEDEAEVALERVLHRLRGLTGSFQGEVSTEALRSLALIHISRHLPDPAFGQDQACLSLGVSRSRLYRAFADGEGVAAVIR